MIQKKILLQILFSIGLLSSNQFVNAQLRVIDNKGTISVVDESKWTRIGSTNNIYNKFLGNVGIGTSTPLATLHNAGSTLFGTLALTNFAADGVIGTAAATVDAYTSINIPQTTAGVTLTIPPPSNPTAGRILKVSNSGTTPFTIGSALLEIAQTVELVWNGSAWSLQTGGLGWSLTGNGGALAGTNFLGTINDVPMNIASNNITMLQVGSRQTLGLYDSSGTGLFPYNQANNAVAYLAGGASGVSALQFQANAASFYKPIVFTDTDGNFMMRGSAAGTDFFELGSAGTANNGQLIFTIGDDGNEPMIFRKYNYDTQSYVEMMRLQGSGLTDDVRVGINTGGITPAATLHNAGSTLFGTLTLPNFTVNGAIGSAAATVDAYTSINIPQTTAGITLNLPAPANTTAGRVLQVSNTGTSPVTVGATSIGTAQTARFVYNGTVWTNPTGGAATVGAPTTAQANGASITGTTLNLSVADATNPGLVSTTLQTIAGAKTFSSAPTVSPFTTAGVVHNSAAGLLSSSPVGLTSDVSGILSGANGGTGVDNTGKTITLGGNFTTSGVNTTTLTTTGPTNVTLPTTGTLYGTETGSISSAQLSTSLSDETGTGLSVFSASPTFTGTPTLPTGTIAATQAFGDNSTAVATTAFVQSETPTYSRVTGANATTTSTALVDIAGLTFAAAANSTYEFEAVLSVSTSAVNTGTGYGVQYTGTSSSISAIISGSTTTTAVKNARISALNTAVAGFLTTSSLNSGVLIKGIIVTTTAGNLTIRHLKTTSGTSTVFINSFLKVTKVQ